MENAGRLLFMAMVTCYLLGRVFSGHTTRPETVVYAATAAFGLDFLIASWRVLWSTSEGHGDRLKSVPIAGRRTASSCAKFGLVEARRTDVLKSSPRMFESDLLDRLSRVHPMVPLVIYVPAIVALLVVGARGAPTTLQVIGLVLAGYMFWTLFEYWLHRLVFHFEPEKGIGARLHWIIHGVHHDHPNDPLRLVMPPSVSIPLALLLWGVFILVLGTPWAHVFTAGFLSGYLAYDMTHYHVHHHRPRTQLGKLVRELHMRHHFQDDTKGFGVSAPFWDYVFGTPQKRRGAV